MIGNRDEADDDQARQHDPGQPRIEIDQHFLQAQEVPRRLRRIRRHRAVRRLLERRLQQDRPDNQDDRADNQRDELGVHQVGPHPDAVRLGLFDRTVALRDALIVQHRLAHRIPGKEHQQEDQADDGHVVRLGDDELEVRIEPAERKEQRQEAQHPVPDQLRREDLALPHHEDEGQHHQKEVQPRVGKNVEDSLYEIHSFPHT